MRRSPRRSHEHIPGEEKVEVTAANPDVSWVDTDLVDVIARAARGTSAPGADVAPNRSMG
jgi:hypothetical protein